VMGWSTSVIGPPDGRASAYLDSLCLLLDRDDAVYWPTHGPQAHRAARPRAPSRSPGGAHRAGAAAAPPGSGHDRPARSRDVCRREQKFVESRLRRRPYAHLLMLARRAGWRPMGPPGAPASTTWLPDLV
jgi:glyoxylase-like metal-dependent hydrolase (beta-lactamase superfamily II)